MNEVNKGVEYRYMYPVSKAGRYGPYTPRTPTHSEYSPYATAASHSGPYSSNGHNTYGNRGTGDDLYHSNNKNKDTSKPSRARHNSFASFQERR